MKCDTCGYYGSQHRFWCREGLAQPDAATVARVRGGVAKPAKPPHGETLAIVVRWPEYPVVGDAGGAFFYLPNKYTADGPGNSYSCEETCVCGSCTRFHRSVPTLIIGEVKATRLETEEEYRTRLRSAGFDDPRAAFYLPIPRLRVPMKPFPATPEDAT